MSLVAKLPQVDPLTSFTSLPAWAYQDTQPVTYSRALAAMAQDLGVPLTQLLDHAGLSRQILDDPAGRLCLVDGLRIIGSALALTGDHLLGFKTGLQMPVTAHGSLGYALMCAPTARTAIGLLSEYWQLRGRGILLNIVGPDQRLLFELIPELPLPEGIRDIMVSSMLASVYHSIQFILPVHEFSLEIWLQSQEPPRFETVASALPEVKFSMPCAGILLAGDPCWLDRALPTSNPEAYAHASAQCEREGALVAAGDDVLRQMRAALVLGIEGYPTPEILATELHMTPRTLRRRLAEHGYNYKQLLEESRCRDSCQLLLNSTLDIAQIGERLGYTDPANFTRAFKRWTGVTPSQWRERF